MWSRQVLGDDADSNLFRTSAAEVKAYRSTNVGNTLLRNAMRKEMPKNHRGLPLAPQKTNVACP